MLVKSCDILVCQDPSILFWSDGSEGSIPDLAVGIGNMSTEEIYIARTRPGYKINGVTNYKGEKINIPSSFKSSMLGKLHSSHGTMYLAHKMNEYFVSDYQVLCAYQPPTIKYSVPSPFTWVLCSNGYVPSSGCVVGGKTESGEATFIGRVPHPDCRPGFIVQSKNRMFYSYYGTVREITSYEALVADFPNDFTWCLTTSSDHSEASNFDRPLNVVYTDKDKNMSIGRTIKELHLYVERPWNNNTSSTFKSASDHMRIVGCISYNGLLSVPYDGAEHYFYKYETLVVSRVPNSLKEFCRYIVLSSTSGVPDRINTLPLPENLKSFCQLREDETKRPITT